MKMRCGLIELYVDLEKGPPAPYESAAVIGGVRRDNRRMDLIRAAAEHARNLGCGLIVFPGWTVVAKRPPTWLLDLSEGTTLVFECLLPESEVAQRPSGPKGTPSATGDEKPWRSYVVSDGHIIIGPARQHVATAAEFRVGNELTPQGIALVRELQARAPVGRRWEMPGVGESLLFICGEVNLVAGGRDGCWNDPAVEDAGLTEESIRAARIIVNPAHTATTLPAMAYKREWLSRGGLLLHTANTHSRWRRKEEGGKVGRGKASHKAAVAWWRGRKRDLHEEPCDGYSIKHFDYEP